MSKYVLADFTRADAYGLDVFDATRFKAMEPRRDTDVIWERSAQQWTITAVDHFVAGQIYARPINLGNLPGQPPAFKAIGLDEPIGDGAEAYYRSTGRWMVLCPLGNVTPRKFISGDCLLMRRRATTVVPACDGGKKADREVLSGPSAGQEAAMPTANTCECGTRPVTRYSFATTRWEVKCPGCTYGASGPTEREAVEQWNEAHHSVLVSASTLCACSRCGAAPHSEADDDLPAGYKWIVWCGYERCGRSWALLGKDKDEAESEWNKAHGAPACECGGEALVTVLAGGMWAVKCRDCDKEAQGPDRQAALECWSPPLATPQPAPCSCGKGGYLSIFWEGATNLHSVKCAACGKAGPKDKDRDRAVGLWGLLKGGESDTRKWKMGISGTADSLELSDAQLHRVCINHLRKGIQSDCGEPNYLGLPQLFHAVRAEVAIAAMDGGVACLPLWLAVAYREGRVGFGTNGLMLLRGDRNLVVTGKDWVVQEAASGDIAAIKDADFQRQCVEVVA